MSKEFKIPAHLFIRLLMWKKLAKLIHNIYRKAKWREDLIGIKIWNNEKKQLRENSK